MMVSVDIGSTWTKGAVFDRRDGRLTLVGRHDTATTTEHLPDGFFEVLRNLLPRHDWRGFPDGAPPVPVRFSSSAKGGLNVVAVGLVPEISLHVARLAAFSAGARVSHAFAYKLTRDDVAAIERGRPDILLLCGGTDGGNETYAVENALKIAASAFDGDVLYAGNRNAADRVREILAGRSVRVCANVMPDFGRLNVEPVRETIREIFLDRIVAGKGLADLARRFDAHPSPTPLAVLNLVDAIGREAADWKEFLVYDLGGATTDVYSYGDAYHPDGGTVMKGMIEPKLKRTVEGDLGMRVSAASAWASAATSIESRMRERPEMLPGMERYCLGLPARPAHIPELPVEQAYDALLAEACLHHALLRHAGRIEEVFTAQGRIWAQSGKDLRGVRRVIGSGGYLAARGRAGWAPALPRPGSTPGEPLPLFPRACRYFADVDYLFPLLGNLAGESPRESAAAAVACLKEVQYDEGGSCKTLCGTGVPPVKHGQNARATPVQTGFCRRLEGKDGA
jgi:uncharacterized protein (TIGR01319 family)